MPPAGISVVVVLLLWELSHIQSQSSDWEIVTPIYSGFDSMASINFLRPAFITGMDVLRERYPQFNVTHRFLMAPNVSSCADQMATVQDILSYWYYTQRRASAVPVIIEAGCQEMELVNQFARAWDILLIMTVKVDDKIQLRNETPTRIGTSLLPSNFGNLYTRLLRQFNWTSVAFVLDTASPQLYGVFARETGRALSLNGFKVTQRNLPAAGQDHTELLSVLRQTSRIVLFAGSSSALRRFLLKASDGNMTNGDYVYLALQPFVHKMFGSFHWQESREDDLTVRLLYQSVLIVCLVCNSSDVMDSKKNLVNSKWQRILTKLAGNATIPELPVPYLVATHAAFEILGQTLVNSADASRGGTHLANQFLKRTFSVDTGAVRIDGNGLRLTTIIVQQFDQESGDHKTFLIAPQNYQGTFDWQLSMAGQWFGSAQFPPNEPLCGYLGQASVCQDFRDQRVRDTAVISGLFLMVATAGLIYFSARLRAARLLLAEAWWKLHPAFLVFKFQLNSTHASVCGELFWKTFTTIIE